VGVHKLRRQRYAARGIGSVILRSRRCRNGVGEDGAGVEGSKGLFGVNSSAEVSVGIRRGV
jgi:hypothetical protein